MNTVDMLSRDYPKVYHMADPRNWDNICKHGLLSTTALLDLFEYDGKSRLEIESQLRIRQFCITHPVYGEAFIRDQDPLRNRPNWGIFLENCLDGVTPKEWFELLNRKTFFWATEIGLKNMLGAKLYRNNRHYVITVETHKLLDNHADKITLSSQNSGSLYKNEKRSKNTFKPIAEYQRMPWVNEFAVEYSVPDIADLILSVDECIIRLENNKRGIKVLRQISAA